jgi:serine/threonine-protein kinase haspin
MRQDKNRGARLARAAATARDDAAAVRSKLEQQKQFFAEVDGFSLASESEGSCASVAKKTPRGVATTRDDANATRSKTSVGFREDARVSASAEKIFPSPSAAARAPAPTTPGTKLALTSEWLRAIPESFSPGEAVDEEAERDLSVDVEEEFELSDDDEEARGGEDVFRNKEKEEKEAPAVTTDAEAEDDVALGSPAKHHETVEDIAAALGVVSLDAPTEDADVETRAAAEPPLAKFLAECGQSAPRSAPPMAEALAAFSKTFSPDFSLATCRKIGEGTYGEAFKSGETVLKIVPMGGETLVNGEPQMGFAQVRAEAAVARRLAALRPERLAGTDAVPHATNVTSGFIDTKHVAVCRGPYAPELLEQWRAYDALHTSENENPALFPADQLYAVFFFADGGVDLEHAEISTYAEAKSVLLQVTVSLAVAEEACRFEHRDLHWGNVLLKKCGAGEEKDATLNGVRLSFPTKGVDVSVIDFTLSRLDMPPDETDHPDDTQKRDATNASVPVFCDLDADPELFKGPEGHCQSETYRRMAKATNGDWSKHAPETNALWLRYLADCLLEDKRFACTAEQTAELKAFRKRAAGYGSAAEALWDGVFVGEFKTNYGA